METANSVNPTTAGLRGLPNLCDQAGKATARRSRSAQRETIHQERTPKPAAAAATAKTTPWYAMEPRIHVLLPLSRISVFTYGMVPTKYSVSTPVASHMRDQSAGWDPRENAIGVRS